MYMYRDIEKGGYVGERKRGGDRKTVREGGREGEEGRGRET